MIQPQAVTKVRNRTLGVRQKGLPDFPPKKKNLPLRLDFIFWPRQCCEEPKEAPSRGSNIFESKFGAPGVAEPWFKRGKAV